MGVKETPKVRPAKEGEKYMTLLPLLSIPKQVPIEPTGATPMVVGTLKGPTLKSATARPTLLKDSFGLLTPKFEVTLPGSTTQSVTSAEFASPTRTRPNLPLKSA